MSSLGLATQGLLDGLTVKARYIATQGFIEGAIVVIGVPPSSRTIYPEGFPRIVYADGSPRIIIARDG